ncbi:deoxynucleoside triphosphate triphosphohydrolase SAMHD1-like isoform X2 [Labrus mixtus]|uniref:deoxynucleoside triphosphate triphosphohydrolase SAMHD1-like isoform X2 n=1 Tax=Labrus mixtus TaxID=508554 RepID=UPI0029BFB808|nr:deoxynucleoside triphosphate triphosphohydrolase SAMHD1-like isoform X2 [Labrus mixtus]
MWGKLKYVGLLYLCFKSCVDTFMSLCVLQHEKGSCDMLDHLVEQNNLKPAMKKYGLIPEKDIRFIKEMIAGPLQESKEQEWPYKGRKEEKSFLYEIVSNKRNGVDVDKFDYLARDSSYLGIKNNFDFHRFLQFARVCKVDGRKTICTRDKEEDNMYDLFYTRHRLHKRAYQHRVNKVIEHMIAEAFVKADGHIEIEGSEGSAGSEGTIGSKGSRGLFTLSTAFKNMEAYTKLTDNVFEEILNSSRPELQEAKKILQDIVSRKIYKFVGERKPKDPIEDWKVINMDYGMKDENPVEHMHFYSKYEPDVAKTMSTENASRIRTTIFSEQLIKVFCKKIDEQSVEAAKKHFEQWMKTKPNLVGPEVNLSDPPAVDTKEITKQHE